MSRYGVYIKAPDGDRLLAVTRRYNGAVNVLDEHVQSKRNVLARKLRPGERVVCGPTDEPDTLAVALLTSAGEAYYSYYYIARM